VPACGVAKVTTASGPCSRDTVRARNDRTPAIMPRILFEIEADDRVSLALIGLIGIAVWLLS